MFEFFNILGKFKGSLFRCSNELIGGLQKIVFQNGELLNR